MAGLVRSVRFGTGEAHGRANMMCYNYLKEHGAFSRNADGLYHIDFEAAPKVIEDWLNVIIATQATGNSMFSEEYIRNHAVIYEALSADLANINRAQVPVDIRFKFVW